MKQTGFLVIADLSNYTAFLTQSDLGDADGILRSVISTVLAHTRPPLVVSRLEGDAIFSYAPDGSFLSGQTLVDAIESTYLAFRRTLELQEHNTTCTCEACTLVPTLDLKFVVHYGAYVVQQIGENRDLQGTDVILVHRLLKNRIVEQTGIHAYAFFTDAAAAAMQLGGGAQGMARHSEHYDHLGEVAGYVHDLNAVWERERDQRRVVVAPGEAWFQHEIDIPAPPALVWEYLHDPDKKRVWFHTDSVAVRSARGGRMGVGAEHRCVNGGQVWRQRFVDWRPFEYVTIDSLLPLGTTLRVTLTLEPVEGGTRLVVQAARASGPGPLRALLGRGIMLMVQESVRGQESGWPHRLDTLRQMIVGDLAAGKVTMLTQAAEAVPQPA